MEETYIIGQVRRIIFQNASFKIIDVTIKETSEQQFGTTTAVTGDFVDIMVGATYEFFGKPVTHERYGLQFQCDHYKKAKPTNKEAVVAFLSGPQFTGVGRKTAEAIYHILGNEAIAKINDDATCLDQVEGLTAARKKVIAEGVRQNYGADQVTKELLSYGFSPKQAYSLFRKYQKDTLEVVKENPYHLIFNFKTLSFPFIDQVAYEMNIASDDNRRLIAGVVYALNVYSQETGNTYCRKDVLAHETVRRLNEQRESQLTADDIVVVIDFLTSEHKYLVNKNDRIFLVDLDEAEATISNKIQGLLEKNKKDYFSEEIERCLLEIEEEQQIQYGPSQRRVLKEAIQSPFYVLTGGPGTGKTTVVKGLIHLYAKLNGVNLRELRDDDTCIYLAAPTGRAAKRMMEATGMTASTIHRLLGLGIDDETMMAGRDIEKGLLIVDEFSMVDTFLAATLFDAIQGDVQVVIVGDKDQLPSVRAGEVLADLLATPNIPHGELTDIYRQGKDSTIISLAHAISEGELPFDFTAKKHDYSFFSCDTRHLETMVQKIMTLYVAKGGYTSREIQVLAPKYKGNGGINALNKMMQSIFNPPEPRKKEVKPFKNEDTVYRIGDKVLCLVNDPKNNVFNGDMGFITGIEWAKDNEDKVDKLYIDFDGNEVTLPRSDWTNVTLAYCCSIHKSQGSEFPIVVMPMLKEYGRMLQRNLLYTGITRAKKSLVLLGEEEAFVIGAKTKAADRQTYLTQRLIGEEESDEETYSKQEVESIEVNDDRGGYTAPKQLTNQLVINEEIDPLIGMDGLTPYDFLAK